MSSLKPPAGALLSPPAHEFFDAAARAVAAHGCATGCDAGCGGVMGGDVGLEQDGMLVGCGAVEMPPPTVGSGALTERVGSGVDVEVGTEGSPWRRRSAGGAGDSSSTQCGAGVGGVVGSNGYTCGAVVGLNEGVGACEIVGNGVEAGRVGSSVGTIASKSATSKLARACRYEKVAESANSASAAATIGARSERRGACSTVATSPSMSGTSAAP